ncbi:MULTISPECIES: CAP domain-containing protein [Nocardioides]|uniref:CAP domain-containing protein n=1 Tax=Nocardioides TaxID=1839 RepID=UPI0030FBC0FD
MRSPLATPFAPLVPLTLLLTLLLSAATVVAPTPAHAAGAAAYERAAHKKTNAQRTKRDLVALRKQKCVQRFADRQARRMARQERMYHQDLGPVLKKCDLSRVAENVAYGYPSGKAVVKGWMGSSGHRANILTGQYRLLGVGAARDDDGRWYAAQVFGRK